MPKRYLFIFGGAIGDTLLGIHLGRTLVATDPGSVLTLVSTRKSDIVRQLVGTVPFVAYQEMLKNEWRSWLKLLQLSFLPNGVAYLAPFRDATPLWWRIISRVATIRGGREVRCHMRDISAPSRVRIVRYNSKTDNLFSMIDDVIERWGMNPVHTRPHLPEPLCEEQVGKPYLLFHFFAGSYRRSIPVNHARELLAQVHTSFPEYDFVLTCAHGEEEHAWRIAQGMKDTRVLISPPIERLLCLLKQSSVCVGVASGVMHIAAHLDVPSVVLCNLSDPCWLPTYNPNVVMLAEREHCLCNGDKTGECGVKTSEGSVYRCLYDIKTEDIIAAMREVLKSS